MNKVIDINNMFLFSGRQEYLHNPKPYYFRIFIWEWNNIEGLKITNGKGKELKRIPKAVIEGIQKDLIKVKKENYPWLFNT